MGKFCKIWGKYEIERKREKERDEGNRGSIGSAQGRYEHETVTMVQLGIYYSDYGAIGSTLQLVRFFPKSIALIINRPGGGAVKYDIVHMRDQAFSKEPLNEFGSLQKMTPKQV